MTGQKQNLVVFAERILPSTQTFIPAAMKALTSFQPCYVGLIPAPKSMELAPAPAPVLLTGDRSPASRIKRELYRWTGIAPEFHRRAKLLNPALIHAHFAEGGSAASFLAHALDRPFILHLRGGAEMMPESVLRKKAYQWPYLFWRKHLWRTASAFLCVSDFIRRKAVQAGFPPEKSFVQYTGINLEFFQPEPIPPARDPNLVLYVGRLVSYKGLNHLIKAMKMVRQSNPDAHLVVIGSGDFEASCKTLAADLNVPCQFLGEKPPAEIKNWLQAARVFCAPSVTMDDGMAEAFGNVFTEAQALGLPVVAYNSGGIPETMLEGETGLLAAEGDISTLGAHIARFLNDDAFWTQASRKALSWTRRHFDVRAQTAKLEQRYQEVIFASR